MDPETRAVYAKKAFIHRIWFKCIAFCISSFGVYAFLFSGFNVESEAREIKEDPRKIFENIHTRSWSGRIKCGRKILRLKTLILTRLDTFTIFSVN